MTPTPPAEPEITGSNPDPELAQRAYIPHDHSSCVEHALERAEQLCASRNQRLTTLRKQVLALVWDSHKPIGAYDILAMMSKNQPRPTAPPTVYRALDFLLEHGLIHKLSSLNAYIGCQCPGQAHDGIFLICQQCRTTRELDIADRIHSLKDLASHTGFQPQHALVELSGLCPECQNLNTSGASEQ